MLWLTALLLQNTALGRMLLHDVPAQSLQAAVQQLQLTASIISQEHNQRLTSIKEPETEQFLLSPEAVKLIKSPSLPDLLGQSCYVHHHPDCFTIPGCLLLGFTITMTACSRVHQTLAGCS